MPAKLVNPGAKTREIVAVFCLAIAASSGAIAGSIENCRDRNPNGNQECVYFPNVLDDWNYVIAGPIKATQISKSEGAVKEEYKSILAANSKLCFGPELIGESDFSQRTVWPPALSLAQRKSVTYAFAVSINEGAPGPKCGEVSTLTVQLDRNRSAQCALGWNAEYSSAQNFCWRPAIKSCGVGNPIALGSGEKRLSEADYLGAGTDSLKFVRHYSSQTYSHRATSEASDSWSELTPFWTHNFDVRIFIQRGLIVGGVSTDVASIHRINSVSYYKRGPVVGPNKISFEPISGAYVEKLTAITDSGGDIVGWELLSADGALERFSGGKLVERWSPSGYGQGISYIGGKITRVVDVFGRALTFNYDESARMTGFLDPAGRAVIYEYVAPLIGVAFSNLASVRFQGSETRTYLYNEAGRVGSSSRPNALTGVVDENGERYATYIYDNYGWATTTYHGSDASKYIVSGWNYTDPLGAARTTLTNTVNGVTVPVGQHQPGGSGCAAAWSAITYDTNGNIASRTDFSNRKVCYANSSTRNLETARIEAYLGTDSCPIDVAAAAPAVGTAQRKITTRWHPLWRLEAQRAEPKLITTWVYNGQADPTNGGVVAVCAPAEAKLPDGQPIAVLCKRVEQPTIDDSGVKAFDAANDGAARVWVYTYNQYGQVLTANGPRTDAPGGKDDATTYTYYADTVFDASGVGHTLGDLATETNALGHVINYGKYDKNGRLLEKTDADGVKTTQTWHVRGWLTSVTRSAGGLSQTTTYDYDKVGQLKKVTEPDTSWVAYTYDAAHRLTDVADSRGNSVHYTLDAMGNRTAEDWKDTGGALRRAITRSYDALNRLQAVTGAAQ